MSTLRQRRKRGQAVRHGQGGEINKDIVAPVASNPGRQQLRSAARSDVIVPRCRTKFGSRAFSIAGPEVWNRLPQSVHSGQQILSVSSDDYWKLTTSCCITVLPNSAVTVFNLVFTLCTFYDCCNASRSAFLYRGALNTLIVLYCIVSTWLRPPGRSQVATCQLLRPDRDARAGQVFIAVEKLTYRLLA